MRLSLNAVPGPSAPVKEVLRQEDVAERPSQHARAIRGHCTPDMEAVGEHGD